jgi:hypothetical protein
VSDEDSFFDEEPAPNPGKQQKPAAKTTAPRPAQKAAPAARAAAAPRTRDAAPPQFFDQTTTYAVAALIGVIGLLLGVLIGYLLLGTPTAAAPTSDTPAATVPAATQSGGQLTTQQVNAGQLPPGHPKISIPATTTAP